MATELATHGAALGTCMSTSACRWSMRFVVCREKVALDEKVHLEVVQGLFDLFRRSVCLFSKQQHDEMCVSSYG